MKQMLDDMFKQAFDEMMKKEIKEKIKPQPTGKAHSIKEIPQLLGKMTVAQLKKQFGTNIFEYKFIGIKDFMTRFNIQSETKYPPRLNYENKHIILDKIAQSYPKKKQEQVKSQAIKSLKSHIKNPPKMLYGKPATQTQIDKINENYQKEINRWG